MDIKKAYEILELDENASKDKIKKRYYVLSKKYKNIEIDEDRNNFSKITEAYNKLMGYEYVDEEVQEKKIKREQNPNKFLKALKIDEDKAENFLYYNKRKIIIWGIALIILGAIVFNIISREPVDLSIDIYGEIVCEDTELVGKEISSRLESVNNVVVRGILPQSQEDDNKLFLDLLTSQTDVFLLDKESFSKYSRQGYFVELDKLVNEFNLNEGLCYERIIQTDPAGNELEKGEEKAYGLDVTNNSIIKSSNIIGEEIIFCLRAESENKENALDFLKLLIQTN